ncbi:MAG: valine--tRNA ligase, partial [Gammaproteobacteria bacterium]|nr:valine--tRNA ligase [Gammaproteobacteria bacterium]
MIGTKVRVPIVGREIPVVADTHVDPKFGTGCVKITPAHDFNDYEIAKRHQLPLINILTPEGKLNENVPEAYQGLDRFEAREKILKELSIVEIKPHALKVPISDRSGVIVEPRLTTQWYVKMEDMAKAAIRAVKDKDIIFYPENAENTYFEWLNNIQDWCISRQLWWGHRIPAWYDNKGNVYVGRTEDEIRKAHQINASVKLTQDEDVLDTWFSSALWPFSTLGWPDTSTPEFKTFYPTSVLVTGFDLIFFWVARMIMFGLKFTGDVPFKHVYFHGIIRDHEGKKMSKSKGNVLDPVDLIDGITLEKLLTKRTHGMMQPRLKDEIIKATQTQFPEGIPAYGCDALRFTFCALASTSRDVNFDMKRMEGYRNFCNKLWNAARFVLMNVEDFDLNAPRSLSVVEDWIWQRFHTVTAECHQALHEYRFDHMAQLLYEFVWNEFCDWYLELSKVTLSTQTPAAKAGTQYSLLALLEGILRLLHPVIPFITETIWKPVAQKLDLREESLMLRSYPISAGIGDLDEPGISFLKEVITQVRTMKSEMNIAPSKPISLLFKSIKKPQKDYLDQFKPWISTLLKAETIDIVKEAPAQCANVLIGQI